MACSSGFLWLDLAPDAVLVALLRSTRVPFAMSKFTIQQAFRDAIFLHAEDIPTHLSWALMRMDSMLVDSARSRTYRLVT